MKFQGFQIIPNKMIRSDTKLSLYFNFNFEFNVTIMYKPVFDADIIQEHNTVNVSTESNICDAEILASLLFVWIA